MSGSRHRANRGSLDPTPSTHYPRARLPAELAFNAAGFGQPIFMYASVLPGAAGYRLRIATPGVLRTLNFDLEGIAVTLFGDPSSHNGGSGHAAFVTNPTACSEEPLNARLDVSSWQGSADSREAVAYPQTSGCDLLQGGAAFSPAIEVQPERTQADTPSGYEVTLKLPQAPDVFGQPATPELRNASVMLPPGLSLSPSLASGPSSLEGCTPAQIDLLGTEVGEGHAGGDGSPYDDGMSHASPGHCPAKSQVGDAELVTPLLEEPLRGHLFCRHTELRWRGTAGLHRRKRAERRTVRRLPRTRGFGCDRQAPRQHRRGPVERAVDGHVRRCSAAAV